MPDPMLGTGGQDLEGDAASCSLAAYILRDKGLTQRSKVILTPINTKCKERLYKRSHPWSQETLESWASHVVGHSNCPDLNSCCHSLPLLPFVNKRYSLVVNSLPMIYKINSLDSRRSTENVLK